MKTKHTPKPWKFTPEIGVGTLNAYDEIFEVEGYYTGLISNSKLVICTGGMGSDTLKIDNIHDKMLIEASPDLLAACKALLVIMKTSKPRKLDEALTWRQNDELAVNLAEQAIKKAEEKSDD